MNSKYYFKLALLMTLSLFLINCMGGSTRYRHSNLVDFLYPDTNKPRVQPSIPNLKLPVKVGVAFVPEKMGFYGAPLHENDKSDLLKMITDQFKPLDYVDKIEIIPSAYLQPQGSFESLDQLKRMFDIDLMVLVSYNQIQNTDEGFLSLSYWTIIGAYTIKGEKNDTNTLIDAAVFDIDSRQLLFRAPGTSHVKGRATIINLDEQLRKDSIEGFIQASRMLKDNLKKNWIVSGKE